MKKKEAITENQSHTCPNPSCGRVFINPVKTENLCSKNTETYDACPFCLTEIVLDKSSGSIEEKKGFELTEARSEQAVMLVEEKKLVEPPQSIQKCTHHFGYLSKRSSKEKIPEECMMCENIVQCMLKNIT